MGQFYGKSTYRRAKLKKSRFSGYRYSPENKYTDKQAPHERIVSAIIRKDCELF